MLNNMRDALEKVSADRAAEVNAVTARLQKLVEELKADQPIKEDLEHHSQLLVKAAEKLKDVAPLVLEIAGRVVGFIASLTF